MERSSLSFILMNLILPFALIGFIFIVFDFQGVWFIIELFVLLMIMILLILAMHAIYHQKKWGWTIITTSLLLLLINVFLILIFSRTITTAYVITIIFSILGMVVAILNLKDDIPQRETSIETISGNYYETEKVEPKEDIHDTKQEIKDELKEEIKSEVKQEVKDELKEEMPPKETIVVAARSSPKKIPAPYVGSAETKKYHIAKCGWVKIMKRKNRIDFSSKRKAEASGFKPHDCVE